MRRERISLDSIKKSKNQLGWNSIGPPQTLVINGKPTSFSKQMADEQMKYVFNKINQLKANLQNNNTDPVSILKESLNRWGTKADVR